MFIYLQQKLRLRIISPEKFMAKKTVGTCMSMFFARSIRAVYSTCHPDDRECLASFCDATLFLRTIFFHTKLFIVVLGPRSVIEVLNEKCVQMA